MLPDQILPYSLPLFPPREFIAWYDDHHPGKHHSALDPALLEAWFKATEWARL